ncbi:pentapeptide repeat-containing protein [Thermocoleostomius sinensis]|uniref:pentapeptide repeat-containing protein n=1 Tax=Thermocoleostomius sinensis TaxID=3065396 RepID=UPI0025B66AB1|nr:pentapeptide repeat-containing protein [Thermocoleostomius sinensis]
MHMLKGKRFYSTKLFWGSLAVLVIVATALTQVQGMINGLTEIASADEPFPRRRSPSPDLADRLPPSQPSQPSGTGTQDRSLPLHTVGLSQPEILEKYQNYIYELVTEENLKQLQVSDPLRNTAKAQTLAILEQLDGTYRSQLLTFLVDSNLVAAENPTVSLHGGNFSNTDFSDRSLSNINLRGANFSDANLNQTDFSQTKLFGATLDRSDLSFANLSNAELFRASLKNANLFLATLTGATLQEADLTAADLFLANLQNTNLNKTTLTNADLSFANLSQAELVFANGRDANLSFVNLSDASLSGADLSRSNLRGANLSNANLSGTNLSNADLTGANLSNANIVGANLTGVILFNTTMPDGTVQN